MSKAIDKNYLLDQLENFNNEIIAEYYVDNGTFLDFSSGVNSALNNKTNKVSSATSGNFAGLDSNGNLTDSGKKPSDFIEKSSTTGLVKNDGTIDTSTYPNTFTGTQEQWNALTTAQKKEYEICNITDDIGTEIFYTKAESDATFATKVLSEPIEGATTVEGALGALSNADRATRQLIDDTVGWENINLVDDNKYAVSNVTRSVVENGIKVLASNASSSNADIRFRNNASNTQPYLVANKSYKISVNIVAVSGTSTAAIAFRNSTGQILSSKAIAGTGKFELTYTPSVDVYISIFVRIGNTGATGAEYIIYKDLMVCDAIYKDFDYQPYHASVEEYCASKQLLEDTVGWKIKNYFTAEGITTGKYLNQDGTVTGAENWRITDYIDISDLSNIELKGIGANGNTPSLCFYDSTKNYISGFRYRNRTDIITIKPSNAVYIKVSVYVDDMETIILTHASVDATKAENTVIAPVENDTTVQNPDGYAIGSHAIRNGAFITWKNAKAQGETIADSDYTSGDVASYLNKAVNLSTFSNFKTVNAEISLLDDISNYRFLIFLTGSNSATDGFGVIICSGMVLNTHYRIMCFDDVDKVIGITVNPTSLRKIKIEKISDTTNLTYGIRQVIGLK